MKIIDFTTNPAGFPLTSDGILGFMQSAYIDAITGVAKLVKSDSVILSGCVITGNSMSSGWVLHAGEVLYFEAGTVQSTFIIEQTTTQLANQNGTLVDRVFNRKAKFGTGAGQVNFDTLVRQPDIAGIINIIRQMLHLNLNLSQIMVLSGCELSGSTMSAGIMFYSGKVLFPASFNDGNPINSGNPVYLRTDGTWNRATDTGALTFNPDTSNRYQYRLKTRVLPTGSIIWVQTTQLDAADFSGALGLNKWQGWRKCDGGGGTPDLTTAITDLTALINIV